MNRGKYRFIIYILFFACFFVFVKFMHWLGDNPETYVEDIVMEYRGVIIEKYFLKTTHLKILTKEGDELDIASLSFDLINSSHVGDSLIKIKYQNCCNLKNDLKNIVMKYMDVPDDMVKDKRWPDEISAECPH